MTRGGRANTGGKALTSGYAAITGTHYESRRGDSNPQPPVYKDYDSRPSRSGKAQPVLNCLTFQSDSSMVIRLGPGPLLADPLANGLLWRGPKGPYMPSSSSSQA
jgi:hypothetical protein